ncbi:uncharacterized protein LOC122244822 isoform X2 [Penaeus japonicus]|uniref:uncharacterized protein LOC122244822 isoform X2 n=1 Tax=Penaeus japonicus TaxID=27405 RepID=UPI001C70DEF3|nr:uncharacterized protein LOC122244822 isoform X2 [Penaeus japonicus]
MIVEMSACSQKRTVKRFLISGVHDQEEIAAIRKKIEELGGKIEDNAKNTFISLCTHVIVKEFNLTEKVLGALASGKWILQPEFVEDSHREGRWLEESQYEIKEFVECRQERSARSFGIYSGWKVYVKLENNNLTKSFRRVVAAGGAEIMSLVEILQSDFIITERKMVASIRETVGPNIPIVYFSYIKDTIVRGISPTDLKPYLLDAYGNTVLARKVDLTRPHVRNVEPKRPLSEMQTNTYRKNLLGITYQQPKLDQFVRIESPGRLSQACSPVRRTPSSSRKRRYQVCQVTPEKQPSIFKYFMKEEPKSTKSSTGKGETCVIENGSDSDVEVLGETSRSDGEGALNGDRTPEVDGNECVITSVQKGKLPIRDVTSDSQKELIEGAIRNRMKITVEKLIAEKHKKMHPSFVDLTGTSQKRLDLDASSDIVNSDEVVSLVDEMVEADVIGKENRVVPNNMEVAGDTVDSNELQRDSTTVLSGVEDKEASSELTVYRTATNIARTDLSSSVQNTLRKESFSTEMLDAQCLLKKVTVNIGPRIDEWLNSNTVLNKVKENEAWNLPVREKKKEFSARQMKINKGEVKRSIVKFVRKSKRVSGIYSSDIVVFDSEISKEFTALSNLESDTHSPPEVRELSVEEISYFESSIDEDVRGIQTFATEEQSIIVTGIDSLYLSITPYTYPPSSLFGDLLRRLVLQTKFTVVCSYALNMAHRILSLHPPKSSCWRTYYYEVFSTALQNQETGCLQAWRFIHHVIECSLSSLSDIDEDDEISDSEAEEEDTVLRENALSLLRFLILVLREDMRLWDNREKVCDLLCWKVFLGQLRKPSITTTPVKHLLRTWIAVQSSDPAVMQCVADLVSIVLEVLWKFERTSLLPVSPLPKSVALLSTEFLLQIKDLGSSQCMKLIHSFSSPWPKMVVSYVIFQEIAQVYNQKINLIDILDFGQAVMLGQCTTSTCSSPEDYPTKRTASPSKKFQLGQNVNKKNLKGETSLLRACITNNVERVQKLLKVPGIDINQTDNSGWTPMHEAAIRGHNECIKLLLNFNCYDVLGPKNSLYPYMKRERFSHIVNLSAKGGEDKQTPLHDAVMHNHLETVKLLLEYGGGSLLNDENSKGETPLSLAPTEEMRTLLRSFVGKPSSMGHSGSKKSQATIKTSVFANGFSKPQGILPCYEDRHSFVIQFINCYLEASGTRSVYFEIQRAFRRSDSERWTNRSGPLLTVPGESFDKCRKNSTGSQSDISVCESKSSSSSGESSSSCNHLPAKQCVVDPVCATSEMEDTLIEQLFEGIRMDLKVFNEYKERRPKPVEESEYLQNLRHQFL